MVGSGSDENFPAVIRPSNIQVGLRPGQTRRALSDINGNRIAPPSYAFAVHRRGVITEKRADENTNPSIPVHLPVTSFRKFAAQLASQEQQTIKEIKPSVEPVYNEDFDVPMFVQHTEDMLQEIGRRMDAEVEMEDVDDNERVVDIDDGDKKNPFAVVEYIEDIYSHYKKTESSSCVPPNYMTFQSDINQRMRGILIDWLVEVHYKFELMDETLYLTVNLIDRFLAVQPVIRKKLQLVGVTAMLLACKYEEVFVPVVEDLVLISDRAYSRKEVIDMEKLMVNTLQFNLSRPTAYVFMIRFLKAAQSYKKLEQLSFFLIELCLVEYEMLKFPPSLLAAAAVFTAQCSLRGSTEWNQTCQKHTKYNEEELMECAKLMVWFHQKAGTGKLTGVHKKYCTQKYGFAAREKPAVFLLG